MVEGHGGLRGVLCVSDQGDQARGRAPMLPRMRPQVAPVRRTWCALAVIALRGRGCEVSRARGMGAGTAAALGSSSAVARGSARAAGEDGAAEVNASLRTGWHRRAEGWSDHALSHHRR